MCSYIEEAFDFYGVEYKMEPVDEGYDLPEYPSKQVIAQVMRSSKRVQTIKKRSLLGVLFSK